MRNNRSYCMRLAKQCQENLGMRYNPVIALIYCVTLAKQSNTKKVDLLKTRGEHNFVNR